MTQQGYYRYPTIHQDRVVFVCEDDLWEVPTSGGIARRLTANLGEISYPWLSPDGEQLAFIGREEGHSEVFVMDSRGGKAKRLTYLGGTSARIVGWSEDGDILFTNNAEHWYLRFTYLYRVSPSGGVPVQLPLGMVHAVAYGPNGGVVIGRHTVEPARWKRYKGGTAGVFWIDRNGDGDFQPMTMLKGNLAAPCWLADGDGPGRLYYISDFEGVGNLYSAAPDGESIRRHTHHEDYYVRSATTDGNRIVYHAGGDLYIYDPAVDGVEKIDVQFHSPQVQRNRKFVPADRHLHDYGLRPDGEATVLVTRGQLFSFANWEGAVSGPAQLTIESSHQSAARVRLVDWLNDGMRLVAVTDANGEELFAVVTLDGSQPSVFFDGLDTGKPDNMRANPAKDLVAFSNHRHEICVLDLEARELIVVDRSRTSPIGGFDWSADGEWLVYSASLNNEQAIIKLWEVSSREVTPVTHPLLKDVAPAFDPNGKFIYFLSYRQFDPVFDTLQFDLGFPYGVRPYLVTLQKDTPSPFIQQPVPLKKDKADDEKAPEEDKPAGEKADAAEGAPESGDEKEVDAEKPGEDKLKIDLEGIQNRILAFPIDNGQYRQIGGTKNGKVVYSRVPVRGTLSMPGSGEEAPPAVLFAFDFSKGKEELLVHKLSDFRTTPDGTMLIYKADNALRVVRAGEKPDDTQGNGPSRQSGWLDLRRIKVLVEPGLEWRQMFSEAWRLQRDMFWTPDLSQIDWAGVYDRYLPLVDRVSSRSEFSDLMWEMQGELGTSHAYEIGGDYRREPRYPIGFLGAQVSYDSEAGAWRIGRIIQGDPWNPGADSPLNAPGMNITSGDYLLAINGRLLSAETPPGALLLNLAGQEVTLKVKHGDDEPRDVTVKTLTGEDPVRYRNWVETNRRKVHEATGGRVGYLHIPDMGPVGFAEFHRGFLSELHKEAMIVDERFNRGGFVSPLLIEKLARKRLGYGPSRWSEVPGEFPPESIAGPIVALANENSGSDGDIFAHTFKLMKLGTLIGKRTWGGVIGIWPRFPLVDGTFTTQPQFSAWFVDVEWGVENYGVNPDIEVDIRPQDYAAGADPQLDKAIEVVLEQLAANPPLRPAFDKRPNLALPKLPRIN